MLAGKGFKDVINMAGGIKAWNSGKAVGPQDSGLSLFSGHEPLDEVLVVAYSLEKGLEEFYQSLENRVQSDNVRQVFAKLATIETKHQARIFDEYQRVVGNEVDRAEFDRSLVTEAMEGGLTTEEYMELYEPDLDNETEVISLAMAIESQALDLYFRAAQRAPLARSREALLRIGEEERAHLKQLAQLLDE